MPRNYWGWILASGALIVLVAVMWIPPIIQQISNHPGNMTLIYRFFTQGHPGEPIWLALWSTAAVFSVLAVGPAEAMVPYTRVPGHAVIAALAGVAVVLVGLGIVVSGLRCNRRFAIGLGGAWP